jgi:hypothetical protein
MGVETDTQRLAKALRLALREIADLKGKVSDLEFPGDRPVWDLTEKVDEAESALYDLAEED